MSDYKIFPFFGFSGSDKVTDIKSGKDTDRSFELVASTLSRMAKNLYPASNVFPAFKSWTYRDMLTGLLFGAMSGTIGEIHVCTHGGSSLLSLAYEFDGGERIRKRAKKLNRLVRTIGERAAGIQALDEEDGLWTGTLSVFPSDPDNWRKRAVDLIKPALDKNGYIHVWGCYAGSTLASLSYDDDAVLGPYFKRFRLRNENPGVARDIAMALGRPVTAAQVLADKSEGGLNFWVRRDNGKIERASRKEAPKAPYWLWPDKNAKWVTFKPDGSESSKVRIWSSEWDAKDVASGKPPEWFTSFYR